MGREGEEEVEVVHREDNRSIHTFLIVFQKANEFECLSDAVSSCMGKDDEVTVELFNQSLYKFIKDMYKGKKEERRKGARRMRE